MYDLDKYPASSTCPCVFSDTDYKYTILFWYVFGSHSNNHWQELQCFNYDNESKIILIKW